MKPAIACLTSAVLVVVPYAAFGNDETDKAENPQSDAVEAAATFERLDKDRDGKVTAVEVPESSRSFFERLLRTSDADEDGALSRGEFLGSVRPVATSEPRRGDRALPRGFSSPEKGRNGGRLFKQLDRNGDDQVTLDEVPEQRRPLFERFLGRADADGDQVLTREEWSRVAAPRNRAAGGEKEQGVDLPRRRGRSFGFFRLLDADGDRKLSAEELAKAPLLLERLDRDGDGALSVDELAPERRGNANRPHRPTNAAGPDLVAGVFERYDTDDDGKISREEAPEPIKRRFSRLDRDRNDLLDPDELARRLSRRAGRTNEKKPEAP